MDNNKYFYFSGFLSFLILSTVIYLFLHLMFHKISQKNFALNKKQFISISIETTPKTEEKSTVKTIVQKSTMTTVPNIVHKNIDINDLFSDVWTKKIIHKNRVKQKDKSLEAIEKKISKVNINQSSIVKKKLFPEKDIALFKNKTSNSSGEEVNEFLAKIHALVYDNFNVPQNSEGYSVKAVIVLNALGQLIDFRILTYSGNDALNKEADAIKERLTHVVFPLHPENKPTKTIVILTSQKE